MEYLNELLQELGISKVKLAKYLGVSRQMIYNYLDLESLNKWPKEKKNLLYKLLDIKNGDIETIKNIKITSEYMEEVENRLNKSIKDPIVIDQYFDMSNLSKEEQSLVNDLIFMIKEKFTEEKNKDTYHTFLYLYNVLKSVDTVSEIKYILCYLSKKTLLTDPNEFVFNETAQFMLESIVYTAFNLYNNGGASKSKLIESHRRFEQEIEDAKEEQLSRTQKYESIKLQALKELGYTIINNDNFAEVVDKITEIQSRES